MSPTAKPRGHDGPHFLDQLSDELIESRFHADDVLGAWLSKRQNARRAHRIAGAVTNRFALEHSAPSAALSVESSFLRQMMAEISTLVVGVAPDSETNGRIKSVQATLEKGHRRGVEMQSIYDKIGIRVIVRNADQCFAVIERLHAVVDHMPEMFDDYICHPKDNGYQSLHTILVARSGRALEVQVRSRDMHQCAEYGSAAHQTYKSEQAVEVCRHSPHADAVTAPDNGRVE